MDADGVRKVRSLLEREVRTRNQFLLQGLRLKLELDEFRLPGQAASAPTSVPQTVGAPRFRLSQVAAAVLAIGVQATLPAGRAMAEPVPATTQQTGGAQQSCCTLTGMVTDVVGEVMTAATITIKNAATNRVVTVKTDSTGRFTAKDLESGKYEVTASSPGFKDAVVKDVAVGEDKPAQLNISLEIGAWGGCCEYAAAPMKAPDDFISTAKPFTYSVGEGNDGGTLRGIAKIMYGDEKKWVLIYEANRDSIVAANSIPYGTSLTIPSSHPKLPKLGTKILPAYPSDASSQKVHGEVAMEVTLNDDGSVKDVKLIEGYPALNAAAVDAVKKWKYTPRTVDGALVERFMVVVTFEKNGKVQ
jgi:TonB family protein